MRRPLLALAAICLLGSCEDGSVTGPIQGPILGDAPRVIVFAASGEGPLAELEDLSFDRFLSALSSIKSNDTIVVALPIEGLGAATPIHIETGFVTVDTAGRTASLTGVAPFREFDLMFALICSWYASPTKPSFALVMRLDSASLGAVVPALGGTPFVDLGFDDATLILSESRWRVPASLADVLDQLAPGVTNIEAGVYFHGSFLPPASLARALELIPSQAGHVPTLRGGLGIDPEGVLRPKIPHTALSLDDMHLEAELPVPAEPVGPMRVTAQTLVAQWAEDEAVVTLHSDVAFDVDGAERPFSFATTIDARGAGAVTLAGELSADWSAPFGLDWLDVDSVALELSGSADAVEMRVTAEAIALDEFIVDLTIDADIPELVLDVTGDLDAAALLRLANGAAGLDGDAEIELPPGGPTLRELALTLRPLDDAAPLVVTAKGTLLADVEADAMLTLVEIDDEMHPVLAFHMGPGLVGALVPALDGSALDDALPGGVVVVPFHDGDTMSIDRSDLAPAARAFLDSAFAAIEDWRLTISPVLHLHAALPLSAVPGGAARVLGLDANGSAILDGAIGATLELLAGSAGLSLDTLGLSAVVPFAGSSALLPQWLEPRSHDVDFAWTPTAHQFRLESELRAVFPDDSVDLALSVDLNAQGEAEHVSLRGRAGAWSHPWGLHWLDLDSLVLTIEGDPDSAEVELVSELEIEGVPARLDVHATGSGDAELVLSIEPELTLDSVARIAGALGGVDAAVEVTLPDGPTLNGITAIVHPGSDAPFTLLAEGALHDGALAVSAMLTLVEAAGGLTPVLVLRTGATSLARIVPAIGTGSALDLGVPALGISLPVPDGPVTIPSGILPDSAIAFLETIFGDGDFDLHLENALRIDAPIALDFVPDAVARALALDTRASAHIGGSLGVELHVLSGASAQIDSLRLFVAMPRRGAPDGAGWPGWLEPRRDSVALFWRRSPAESRLDVESVMMAQLHEDSVEFRIVADLASDSSGERAELRGRSGAWPDAFGVDWLDVDSLGLLLTHEADSTTAELAAALEVEGRPATLDVLVVPDGLELELDVDTFDDEKVTRLLAERWPELPLPSHFPHDVVLDDVFVYVRLSDEPGFSVGGMAHFMDERATMLVSAARGPDGPLLLAGFAVADFALGDVLSGAISDSAVVHHLDVFSFDTAAILYSNVDAEAASHTLDRHALEFYRMAFGDEEDEGAIPLQSGISVIARRELPAGGSLDSVLTAIAPHSSDRTVVLSGTIPASFVSGDAHSGNIDGLAIELALPDIAPASPGWFRHGQLAVVLSAAPIELGLEGELGVRVDDMDVDFVVSADVTSTGTLEIHGTTAVDQGWIDPFGTTGVTLRRLGLDLTLNAFSVGLCVGGDVSIGREDIRGAVGLDLNIETGVPTGGVFFAQSDRGFSLDDLVEMQDDMFDAPPLPLGALPDMRLDSLELLIALPNPGSLACLPRGTSDFFEIQGTLQVELDSTMHRIASADVEVGRDGIIAKGSIESGAIGPISWTRPLLDLALTLEDQHLDIHGAASIGDAFHLDSLALSLHRDSMSFATSFEVYDGIHASISAAANPSLSAPRFHVSGEIEGRYVDSLSTEVYRSLRDASRTAETFLDEIRSNPSGIDLDDAVADARAASDAALSWWRDAETTMRSLVSEQRQCSWRVCVLRYDVEIDAWQLVVDARWLLYSKAHQIYVDLQHIEALETQVDSALVQLRHWLENNHIEISRAAFHTDLDQLLAGDGFELHVTGSIDQVPLDVACDLDADFAGNVAAIVRAILPAGLGSVPGL